MKASPPGTAYTPLEDPLEAELQTELLICSECQCPTKTIPAENVPAQALRYGISCNHVFFMELPDFHQSIVPSLWRPTAVKR